MQISYKRIEIILMQIAIILTILSFSPQTSVANICGIIMFAFWGGVVLFKILSRHLYFDNYVKYLAFVYVVWFLCTKLFFRLGLYPSGGLGVAEFVPYCMIFYVIGFNMGNDEENLKQIINAFFFGEACLTITLLPYLEAIEESPYLFSAKNQTGQMLGMGVVFGFFVLLQYNRSIVAKIAVVIFTALSLMSLLIVASRTPLVAVGVVAIVSFVSKKDKQAKDYVFLLTIVLAFSIVIYYLGGIDYLLKLFDLTDTSQGIDVNDMTSGRLDLYAMALSDFAQSPLIGLGGYAYIDNFIVNILRCGGLLSLVLIIPISYGKMFNTYKKTSLIENGNELLSQVAKSMLIFYFIVSLMEGFPPMGPNTSVFFLWILIGIVSGKECVLDATE